MDQFWKVSCTACFKATLKVGIARCALSFSPPDQVIANQLHAVPQIHSPSWLERISLSRDAEEFWLHVVEKFSSTVVKIARI